MSSLNAAAKKIVRSRPQNQYWPKENLLFQYLYDAYCKLEQPDDSFEAVVAGAKLAGNNSSGKYIAARQALVNWYTARYRLQEEKDAGRRFGEREPNTHKRKKTNRGIQRVVLQKNIEEGTYRFDEPVRPELFEVYLNDFSISGNPFQTEDARSFILHTAVAFLLSPEQLDHLLVTVGFHPLHVRHIHDMAIYVVLRDAAQNWTPEERRERSPFQEVREVYESARLLLLQTQAAELHELSEDEQAAFRSDSTRVVQQYIHGQNLSRENLLAYVGNHTKFYNLRHHRLLSEHKRLVNLFSELYMRGTWYGDEAKYSLYAFLAAYCKSFKRRRFKDQVYWYVNKYGRHPTREFMIVLWIYAYCFLFCPEVLTPCDFSQVVPFRRTTKDPGLPLERPFPEYFDKKSSCLRVLEYLSDTRDRASPLNGFYDGMTVCTTFKGSELVAFINSKLADYAWRQLDGRNVFDRSILSLSPLEIIMRPDGTICAASYDNEQMDDVQTMNADNVPGPLVVIFRLLQKITDLDNAGMPLPCNMYELI